MSNLQFQLIEGFFNLPLSLSIQIHIYFIAQLKPSVQQMSNHPNTPIPAEQIQLEASQLNRVLRSDSKPKQPRRAPQNSANEEIHIDGQQGVPKSIEKQRYTVVEPHSPLNHAFDNSYQKPTHSEAIYNNLRFELEIPDSQENEDQNQRIKPKKCAQIQLDESFEDRNSAQTMDDKNISSSFELQDPRSVDKSSQGMKVNRMTLGGAKNKDYFDHYIIEDDQENEEQKRTEANGQDQSSRRSSQKIQFQVDYSDTYYDQSVNHSEQREKSLSELDIDELKLIEKRKILERNQIEAAQNQVKDDNDFLQKQISILKEKIQKALRQQKRYAHYENMMASHRLNLNTRRFDQTLQHLRKFSL